nr:PREDICTED: uncharacterized protein LOC108203286 [Daucus carota subsp. sativus]
MPGYTVWYFHGEGDSSRVNIGTSSRNVGCTNNFYDAREMLDDFVNATGHFENDEEPNATAKIFYKMLDSASQPIYPDNTSNKGFDELLELIGSVLPNDHNLPTRYYDVKKLVSGLNMGYQKIDACVNDCMLFYKEDSEKIYCDICNESRYKAQKDHKKKMIPQKILRYFPLTLRLQRLFMSEKTAKCMTWHHDRVVAEDQLNHPADGDEWKQFDRRFPRFTKEIQNVRIGLASDGFDPFRDAHAREYTVWPVIVVVYNLPPSMCTKAPYMFMPLLIPGPSDPTKDFHVYLRPLIDELKILWHTGVETYDRASRSNFMMRVALMWTINDFPALGMISGWSTKGKLACPVCMGEVKAKQLKYGGKPTFYGTARYFLEEDDSLRRSTKFGRCDKHSSTTRHSGLIAKTICEQIQFPPPGKTTRQKPRDYGVTHNWTHSSPFYELPYWETLRLRHNIDVMHTEKNVFDNIFYTMLDDKKKSKDTLKSRLQFVYLFSSPIPIKIISF